MTNPEAMLFGPVFAQAVLTTILYLMLVQARFSVANDASLDRARLAYDQSAWPLRARLISNAVVSQFELPVLFYVGAAFALHFDAVDKTMVILAWIFVILRVVHALIHTTKNIVIPRFGAFLLGFITLIIFWAVLAIRVFGAMV